MEIYFGTGVMGAGKSKGLIETFKHDDDLNKFALLISLDYKSADLGLIESRDGQTLPCLYLNKKMEEEDIILISVILQTGFKKIYIDEIQFLEARDLKRIISLCKKYNVDLYLYGISTDFKGDYFESSKYLLDHLPEENIFEFKMQCECLGCRNVAKYNARIVDGKVVRNGERLVTQKSKYLSLCQECYNREE